MATAIQHNVYLDNLRNAARLSSVDSVKMIVFAEGHTDYGQVVVQMREVCEAFAKDKTKWLMHEWWKGRRESAFSFLAQHGFCRSHIRPSSRSMSSRARPDDVDLAIQPYVQQEWTCTLSSMLFLLVDWGQASHTRAQKEQAFNIFSDILQLTFAGASSDILWEDAEWDAPPDDMEEPVCDDRPAASDVVCEHLRRAQERFQELRRAGTFLDLVRFAFEASQTSAACRRMHFWVVELLCSLAESMERRLVGQCVGQHTPEGLRQLDRKSKRRRLDPELRRMAEVAVAEGRFRSQPAMARAGFAGVCRRTARDFDMKMLCEYLGATAKLFDNTRQLCIACDGSRLGGEDTLLFAAWLLRDEKAARLPLQVVLGAMGASHGLGVERRFSGSPSGDMYSQGYTCFASSALMASIPPRVRLDPAWSIYPIALASCCVIRHMFRAVHLGGGAYRRVRVFEGALQHMRPMRRGARVYIGVDVSVAPPKLPR